MYAYTVPPLTRSLTALGSILDKAEGHFQEQGWDSSVMIGYRLYPDMLPFARQVQLTCDFAARMAARLCGHEPQSFPDVENTLSELITRVQTAKAYIAGFKPEAFEGAETRQIVIKLRGGERSFSGLDYAMSFALPQFYFHMATAYDILRHNGVPLGKADFMGA
jgi:uncharacterized protein